LGGTAAAGVAIFLGGSKGWHYPVTDALNQLIRYRLARAKETLQEARELASGNHWNGVANRLYYSCFYAATAWLVREGLTSTKHTGVRSLVNQRLIVPGLITKELGVLYNDLFELRQEGDYEDFVYQTSEEVAPLMPQAEDFVIRIGVLVADKLGDTHLGEGDSKDN
jgi:uncharacterized protein (UPF0332 family)